MRHSFVLGGVSFEFFRLGVMLVFLLMLVYAFGKLGKDAQAYNHLVNRKLKRRTPFVE